MRPVLDALYRISGALAAVCLAAIAVVVLAQVGLNVVDALAAWLTGSAIGLVIPSYAEFAGYFLAAASFLALAYSLRAGAHIRVTLVRDRLAPGARRIVDSTIALFATGLCGYATVYMVLLVADSWRYGDVSPGMIAVPLWLPQAAMAAGLVVLTIAMADTAWQTATGRDPEAMPHADAAPVER